MRTRYNVLGLITLGYAVLDDDGDVDYVTSDLDDARDYAAPPAVIDAEEIPPRVAEFLAKHPIRTKAARVVQLYGRIVE